MSDIDELKEKAERGDAYAQDSLGWAYQHGEGVERDFDKAFFWYSKAAEQGSYSGKNNVGYMYNRGFGVDQDYEKALHWYEQAAPKSASARKSLGLLYARGHGVPKDLVTAYMWFYLAFQGNKGLKDVATHKQSVEEDLSSEEIQQAETLAEEWLANNKV